MGGIRNADDCPETLGADAADVRGTFMPVHGHDYSGFDPNILRFGTAAPEYARFQKGVRMNAVAESVGRILSDRSGDGRKRFLRAFQTYVHRLDASELRAFGFDVSRPEVLEGMAYALLEKRSLRASAEVAAIRSAHADPEPFWEPYLENFATWIEEMQVRDEADPKAWDSALYAISLLSDCLITRETLVGNTSGRECYLRGRFAEWNLDQEGVGDLEGAALAYRDGILRDNPACVVSLANLLFRTGNPEEGLRMLEEGWKEFQETDILSELARRSHEMGRGPASMRYFRIYVQSVTEGALVLPEIDDLSFPRDLVTISRFMAYREISGNTASLDKALSDRAETWIRNEFETFVAAQERGEIPFDDDAFEYRLSLLQFGAIELSLKDFALRYLAEIAALLPDPNDGEANSETKDVLFAVLSEIYSPYAEAVAAVAERAGVEHIEDFLRSSVRRIAYRESEQSTTDAFAKIRQESGIAFTSLQDAIGVPLSALCYRFGSVDDEDVLGTVSDLSKRLTEADDSHETGIESDPLVDAAAFFLRDRENETRKFEMLPSVVTEWYWALREEVSNGHSQSEIRSVIMHARYGTSGISGSVPERLALLFLVETLLSETKLSDEALDGVLDAAISHCRQKDVVPLSRILLTYGLPMEAVFVALATPSLPPEAFRSVLLAVATFPDSAEDVVGELSTWSERFGIGFEGVLEFALSEARRTSGLPDSFSVAIGNVALAIEFFWEGIRAAMESYLRADALGDSDAAGLIARAKSRLGEHAEAIRYARKAYEAGNLFMAADLARFHMAAGNRKEAFEWVLQCERLELYEAASIRGEWLLSGNRSECLEGFRFLSGRHLFPYGSGLSDPVLEAGIALALPEASKDSGAALAFAHGGSPVDLLSAFRFLAAVEADGRWNDDASVPKGLVLGYWTNLATALEVGKFRNDVIGMLSSHIHADALADFLSDPPDSEDAWRHVDDASVLVAEFSAFRQLLGVSGDAWVSEISGNVEFFSELARIFRAAERAFRSVPGGAADAVGCLAEARAIETVLGIADPIESRIYEEPSSVH